jgi:hypothetical protein
MVVAADVGRDESVAEVRVAAGASSAAKHELSVPNFVSLNSGYFPNAAL